MKNRYFRYLCDLVGREYEYSRLLEYLHGIEFYPLVPNDDNRGADGEQLRIEYCEEVGLHGPSSLPMGPCTVLEMFVGLAKRLKFDLLGGRYERSLGECFWLLIENLGLEWYDNVSWVVDDCEFEVNEKIKILLERQYATDGSGGLFPLRHSERDQRRIEIWYQMSAWIIENCPV